MNKGFIHTLEAAIAAIILVGFIIMMFPPGRVEIVDGEELKLRGFNALAELDERGSLRIYAREKNVTGLEQELKEAMADCAAAISYLEKYNGSATLSANWTMEIVDVDEIISALLILKGNAQNLKIYLKPGCAEPIWSGDLESRVITENILGCLQEGNNTLSMEDSGNISWTLGLKRFVRGTTPPLGKNIRTASYLLAGWNKTVEPTEVMIYVW